MRKIHLLLAIPVWLLHYSSFSQSATSFEAGLKISKEFTEGKDDGASIGIQSVFTFGKITSIDFGISYKAKAIKQLTYQNLGPNTRPLYEPFSETEQTILIPIACRFNTGLVTISAGSGLHILLNKEDFSGVDIPEKTDWKENNLEILTSLGISRAFRVNKTLYIEPEVKYCRYSQNGGNGFQLNLSFRRRF